MARRKKHGKKHHRRRHIGAVGKGMFKPNSPLVQYGSIAAGWFVGTKINDAIDKAINGDKPANEQIDGKIVAAAEAILGGMLYFSKKKTMAKTVAGGVLLGAGVKRGLKEFGVINGFQSVPVLAGYQSVPVLGGYSVPTPGGSLAGYSVPTPGGSLAGRRVHKSVMGSIGDDNGSGVNPCDR